MSYLIKTNNELMKEWIYEKNTDIDLDKITSGSEKKAWWKCSRCGFEWITRISTRTHGSGCPSCAQEARNEKHIKPKKGQSLKEKSPYLVGEWNYEKNDRGPEDYYNSSNLIVWWRCSKCGHEW